MGVQGNQMVHFNVFLHEESLSSRKKPMPCPLPYLLSAALLLGVAAVIPLQRAVALDTPADGAKAAGAEIKLPGLHNVFRLSDRLYTGAVPEGEEGFRSLQKLGIRTVLTVDGEAPDVKLAKQFGLRYVHLPFGYDGCPVPQANRIVKAVRDLPGPVYLHCHHGKHRAPSAGALVRRALDGLTPEEATREMERAGTGKNYVGLYGGVRDYQPPTAAELDRMLSDFPAISPTPPLVQRMVELGSWYQKLQAVQAQGWEKGEVKQAAHLALQLREQYRESTRMAEVKARPEPFRVLMRQAETDAESVESALRKNDFPEADRAFSRVAAGCGSCHKAFRDVPGK
jgi:protein tyrosine phosphatase (PTP) superfamily phosphohydrolase (DUF442 family)